MIGDVLQLIELGGPVVVALLVLSVLGLTVFLFKLVQYLAYSQARLRSAELLVDAWIGGRETSHGPGNPYERLLATAMGWLDEGVAPERVRDELTRQGQMMVARVNSLNGFVELVAYLAPLGGLLGTVLGMIDVFQGLAHAGGSGPQTGALAGGIWEALLTTVVGLCVAIPFALMHALLEARAMRIRAHMENQLSRLFTADLYRSA
ncbi:MAG: MotA/TolQ/ExbB proton channel family protein [Pseudomonadales bacterium]|nr:MotA/TolQ/ExbB proton channel family protein [Pseudomonadales bacterium]